MGLNRMMMKNGRVKVEDGSKFWGWGELDSVTISFTVPPGIKRIKVYADVDFASYDPDLWWDAFIKNKMTNKIWGSGQSVTDSDGENIEHENIDSIVGVTPNKIYTLYFECINTMGVTFSWGKAINDMKPTVEDY